MIDPSMMGGPPPDMMGGGTPPMGPGPGGPPPGGPEGPSVTSKPGGGPDDALRIAIDALTQFLEETQDDQDLAVVSKIQADIQKVLSDNVKLADQAVGAGPGARFLRKQNSGGSPPAGF